MEQTKSAEQSKVISFAEALRNKASGNKAAYDQLVAIVSSSKAKRDRIRILTSIALENISLLSSHAGTLIQTLLDLPWGREIDETSDKYLEFITLLITQQIHSLRMCITTVVRMFSHHELESLSETVKNTHYNARRALDVIFSLVPTSPRLFMEVLETEYPYKAKETSMHVSLVSNLILTANAYPSLEEEIIQIVTSSLIKMDAEIPRKELEEISQDLDTLHDCTELDPVIHKTHQYAIKVDLLVSIILSNLKSNVFRQREEGEPKLSKSRVRRVFPIYLSSFKHIILPTHGTSHVQSIIFYLSSLDLQLGIAFIDFLWSQVNCLESPSVVRESACCYLASYISRAKFLTPQIVVNTITTMAKWLHRYIEKTPIRSSCPDILAHSLFYSLAQALLYIFVFRHRLLVELPNGMELINSLKLQNIVFSKLNPLKVCLPTITDMFAGICKHYQILFCYTLMEQNKRIYMSKTINALADVSDNYLLSFFPFDPYLLPTISDRINPMLFSWCDVEPDFIKLEEELTQAEDSVMDLSCELYTDETWDSSA